jgi:hypothetical protein
MTSAHARFRIKTPVWWWHEPPAFAWRDQQTNRIFSLYQFGLANSVAQKQKTELNPPEKKKKSQHRKKEKPWIIFYD